MESYSLTTETRTSPKDPNISYFLHCILYQFSTTCTSEKCFFFLEKTLTVGGNICVFECSEPHNVGIFHKLDEAKFVCCQIKQFRSVTFCQHFVLFASFLSAEIPSAESVFASSTFEDNPDTLKHTLQVHETLPKLRLFIYSDSVNNSVFWKLVVVFKAELQRYVIPVS